MFMLECTGTVDDLGSHLVVRASAASHHALSGFAATVQIVAQAEQSPAPLGERVADLVQFLKRKGVHVYSLKSTVQHHALGFDIADTAILGFTHP